MTAPRASSPRLDRSALLHWLTSEAVVDDAGRVWSWHNPVHPGYPYPEAAGLWLSLMAREPGVAPQQLDRVAHWLKDCEQRDRLGRDGRSYLFDRGMVLAGRLAWAQRREASIDDERPLVRGLLAELHARRPLHPPAPDDRWSTRFGPHLLKLALPLATWSELGGSPDVGSALVSLFGEIRPCLDDGRVITAGRRDPTYLHAHCYAAEGLWRLSTTIVAPALATEVRAMADQAADWLARVQRADGGLPPWHDGERGWGPAPSDVAAQAVRLWCGLDRQRHRESIDRALAFLARQTAPEGGLRYHERSADVNTWATIFAVQALDFAWGRANSHELI